MYRTILGINIFKYFSITVNIIYYILIINKNVLFIVEYN